MFTLRKPPEDGVHTYVIPTKEGRNIKILFYYQNNMQKGAKVTTDFSANKLSRDEQERGKVFTVTSKKGYDINFKFYWRDGKVTGVMVYPKIDAYDKIRL